jgi:hypothetical protein
MLLRGLGLRLLCAAAACCIAGCSCLQNGGRGVSRCNEFGGVWGGVQGVSAYLTDASNG